MTLSKFARTYLTSNISGIFSINMDCGIAVCALFTPDWGRVSRCTYMCIHKKWRIVLSDVGGASRIRVWIFARRYPVGIRAAFRGAISPGLDTPRALRDFCARIGERCGCERCMRGRDARERVMTAHSREWAPYAVGIGARMKKKGACVCGKKDENWGRCDSLDA